MVVNQPTSELWACDVTTEVELRDDISSAGGGGGEGGATAYVLVNCYITYQSLGFVFTTC